MQIIKLQYKSSSSASLFHRATVYSWGDNGPESRIKLLGIFPGAKVFLGPSWYYDEKVNLLCAQPIFKVMYLHSFYLFKKG